MDVLLLGLSGRCRAHVACVFHLMTQKRMSITQSGGYPEHRPCRPWPARPTAATTPTLGSVVCGLSRVHYK